MSVMHTHEFERRSGRRRRREVGEGEGALMSCNHTKRQFDGLGYNIL